METKILNIKGEQVGTYDLADSVFAVQPNPALLHFVVKSHLAAARQGTQSTLTRTEVSGGGRKPWRQKGTGHARQGSIRSPQWTHGGIALGPKPRSYRVSINKKVRAAAIKQALSDKALNGDLVLVDDIALDSYKTKEVAGMFKALDVQKKPVVITENAQPVLVKSAANIPGAKVAFSGAINTYDILNADKLVLTKGAAERITEVFA